MTIRERVKLAMSIKRVLILLLLFIVVNLLFLPKTAEAQTITSSNSQTVTALVPYPAPTTPAIILQPVDGNRYFVAPLVVRGTCEPSLLVRVFNGSDLAGSITCALDGTFIINITLNNGENVLTALNYDILNQSGPASPQLKVFLDVITNNRTSSSGANNSTGSSQFPEVLDNERLFEGTLIEPISKILGIKRTVSTKTNNIIGIFIYVLFGSIVLVLALMLVRGKPEEPLY